MNHEEAHELAWQAANQHARKHEYFANAEKYHRENGHFKAADAAKRLADKHLAATRRYNGIANHHMNLMMNESVLEEGTRKTSEDYEKQAADHMRSHDRWMKYHDEAKERHDYFMKQNELMGKPHPDHPGKVYGVGVGGVHPYEAAVANRRSMIKYKAMAAEDRGRAEKAKEMAAKRRAEEQAKAMKKAAKKAK